MMDKNTTIEEKWVLIFEGKRGMTSANKKHKEKEGSQAERRKR
jgi:hypothetical protein